MRIGILIMIFVVGASISLMVLDIYHDGEQLQIKETAEESFSKMVEESSDLNLITDVEKKGNDLIIKYKSSLKNIILDGIDKSKYEVDYENKEITIKNYNNENFDVNFGDKTKWRFKN